MALLVGLDGGGTWTRVLVLDTDGAFRAHTVVAGCNPENRPVDECVANASDGILRALEAAGGAPEDVRGLVAGIAGLTAPGDAAWAERITATCGLPCTGVYVGDNVVAQTGAFGGAPGIVFCAGTGSIVFGVTAGGQQVCNYDFQHYAPAGSWHLGRVLLLRLAAGEAGAGDGEFVAEILADAGLDGIAQLRTALRDGTLPKGPAGLAPRITAAAERGAPLARAVCAVAAEDLARGVRLLGPCFASAPVRVAPAGSVASAPYMARAVARLLEGADLAYAVTPALHPPVVGAAITALRQHGATGTDAAGALTRRIAGG